MRHLFILIFLLLSATARATSLEETTNLVELGIPDVLAEQIEPYDSRTFDINVTINGEKCCKRDMYRAGGYKIVLLSHQNQYFIAFLLDDDSRRYFVAETPGTFVEKTFGRTTSWEVPDWLSDQASN